MYIIHLSTNIKLRYDEAIMLDIDVHKCTRYKDNNRRIMSNNAMRRIHLFFFCDISNMNKFPIQQKWVLNDKLIQIETQFLTNIIGTR